MDDEVDTALSRVRPLLGLVAQHADGANAERRPAQPVIDAFGDAGLMRLVAPAAYGGHEAHPEVLLAVVEAVAAVDGSTGWTVMTCNEEMGIACAFLPAATMSALVRERPDVVIAGSGLTSGRARRAPGEDGWLVSGRWRFVTGCPAADMIVLGNLVDEAGGGPPSRSCYVLVPRSEVAIEDTWKVAGMRGTGSHDVVLDDRFVADRWAGVSDAARGVTVPDTAFFRLPYGLRFPFPKVGVAAGIARAAIASFVELAGAKTPVAA
ncbi:MAG: acyl-CoA dehydrogenase family protein, partial [Acidimicrobiia bacterium]|nr:acyl-CoA dehydrogenase family protein [Acidimicrobiia bacterium]